MRHSRAHNRPSSLVLVESGLQRCRRPSSLLRWLSQRWGGIACFRPEVQVVANRKLTYIPCTCALVRDHTYVTQSYTGGAVAVTYTGETNATHLFEDFNTIFGANTQGSTWLEVPSQPATSDQQATMLLTNMGLQVVVHIITNADEETQLVLSLPTLAAMFLNTVQYWDDAAIASDNPGFQLPHHRIT